MAYRYEGTCGLYRPVIPPSPAARTDRLQLKRVQSKQNRLQLRHRPSFILRIFSPD